MKTYYVYCQENFNWLVSLPNTYSLNFKHAKKFTFKEIEKACLVLDKTLVMFESAEYMLPPREYESLVEKIYKAKGEK